MKKAATNQRLSRRPILTVVFLSLTACGGGGAMPVVTLPHLDGSSASAVRDTARLLSVREQIAAGDIAPACPTAVLGRFYCLALVLRHTGLAPLTEGRDHRKIAGYGPVQLQKA